MPVARRFPPHESAVAVGVIHPFGCTWIRYLAAEVAAAEVGAAAAAAAVVATATAAATTTATVTGSNVASKSNDTADPSAQPGLTGSGWNEK
ncbi:hypothetical protein HZH68_007634 [Vespula germanica]|uniref:Uncharacterized protein n=1 Tax=Vespula germanica TaxID=30212 RepID=A0A834K7B5_VESGE|nr:hypothetical protein HZH68_007634 [Vespula germanica]